MISGMNDQADDGVFCNSKYFPVNHFKFEIRTHHGNFRILHKSVAFCYLKKYFLLEISFSCMNTSDFVKE